MELQDLGKNDAKGRQAQVSKSSHALLGKKHTLASAKHTLILVLRAVKQGDLRLAVSRGITAIIQATAAAVGTSGSTVSEAANVVQAVRNVIHGAVIKKAASSLGGGFRFRSRDPFKSLNKKTPAPKKTFVKSLKTVPIPGGIFIPTKSPVLLETILMRSGIEGRNMTPRPDGLEVRGEAAKKAMETINEFLSRPLRLPSLFSIKDEMTLPEVKEAADELRSRLFDFQGFNDIYRKYVS